MSRASGQPSPELSNRSTRSATVRRATPQCIAISRWLRPASKWYSRTFFTFLIGNLPRAIASLRPFLERRQGTRGTHESSVRNHPNRAATSVEIQVATSPEIRRLLELRFCSRARTVRIPTDLTADSYFT